MSPSLRQQINMSILETEQKLRRLQAQPDPNPHSIEGERRELQILQQKLKALPLDEPSIAYA